MPDTYEKDLAQKSSLTTSDFIRVVGSDNVSYKQNIGDVNKTIPLNSVGGLTTEALIDQAYITAHTETPDGTLYRRLIYHGFAHSILGGGVYYLEGYRASSSYGWQRITCYGNPTRIFTRSINNGTWTTWAKEPTRAEVDALSTTRTATINTSASISGVCTYIQAGKMVTVSGTISIPSGTASTVELVTGLPNCLVSNAGFVANNNNTTSGYIDMFITANGALRLKEASTSTVSARFTFSYVAS